MENRVYIANLGKYNEGELVGAWFTLPIYEDEIADAIGLDEHYEEWAIHDYDFSCVSVRKLGLGEDEDIEYLNEVNTMLEEISEKVYEDDIEDLLNEVGSLSDLYNCLDDIYFYSGMDLLDLAEYFVEEDYFGEVSEKLLVYIDYDKLARDLSIEGRYVETNNGIYEIVY